MNIDQPNFLILGASSGIGYAIAEQLCVKGLQIVAVARRIQLLNPLQQNFPNQVKTIKADVMTSEGMDHLYEQIKDIPIHGVLINAGGPPAGDFRSSELEHWDSGYQMVLRWKIDLLLRLLPKFEEQNYGRIVFIESVSIKQPIPGLVLSNTFRMAVAGLMKSIVNEVTEKNITFNIIAPGYHKTDRLQSLMEKQVTKDQSIEAVELKLAGNTTIGRLGDPQELASLATWLLSEESGYVTGQTLVVDGGLYRGSL